ncbi:MAG: LPXTG cell wall anchor domain-containing protein, partial [Lachnospiraceae bacterium]
TLTAATGYEFTDSTTATVLGNNATSITKNTDGTLTVTYKFGATAPKPSSDPVDYEILDGANSSWTQNSDGSLSIRGSGEFSKFVGVKVDGNLVDAKNYTVKEGSTIVTLKADYLNTLSVGSHTFEMIWTDGTASTTFTIMSEQSETPSASDNGNNNRKEDVPKTGDDTPIGWLFILSILSGTGLIITVKKRRVNPNSSKR